jgi:hypothetical protein
MPCCNLADSLLPTTKHTGGGDGGQGEKWQPKTLHSNWL